MKNKFVYSPSKDFEQHVQRMEKRNDFQKLTTGKHKCKFVYSGQVNQVVSTKGQILKNPKILMKFFECEKCGVEKIIKYD